MMKVPEKDFKGSWSAGVQDHSSALQKGQGQRVKKRADFQENKYDRNEMGSG